MWQVIELSLQIYFGVACACMGLVYLNVALRMRRVPRLDRRATPEVERWPSLSIIVAARDEVETLEPALRSLMEVEYPGALEVLCVNDRSSDGTGALLDQLAERHERLRSVHVDELPEGWLGKVHAMDRARGDASGEWILFTDADVIFAPDVLTRAIGFALEGELDHLTMIPRFRTHSLWAESCMAGFGLIFVGKTQADRVQDPESEAYVGIGAFNLVRREALDRTEGLELLKMEVGDDVGLGWMLKRSGARSCFLSAGASLDIVWYEDLPSMFRGLEKNSFGVSCYYTYSRLALVYGIGWTGILSPLIAPLVLPGQWGLPLLLFWALCCGVYSWASRRIAPDGGLSNLGVALVHPGLGLVLMAIGWSAWRCWRQGGVFWRDTFYPIEALRAGQRFRL